MLNDETKRKLRLMNIGEFISAVDLQEDDPQLLALPFSERFQMAVDHVYQDKYNMKSERLIKQAKLRFPAADIHDIYYGEKRRLNRNLMGEIATCQYIEEHEPDLPGLQQHRKNVARMRVREGSLPAS